MLLVNRGQVGVLVGDIEEFHRQLVGHNKGAQIRHVSGIAPPVNAECDVQPGGAGDLQRLERRHNAALLRQARDNQKSSHRHAGGFDVTDIGRRNAGINDVGMTDTKTDLFGQVLEGLAAKVDAVQSGSREWN